ncbi:hypothetical protein EV360DRAFT_81643 [Lentinula raphanica]|nr:hypothetical protein EV360DRAFT_81643 [Lentinula raphanica]
MSVTNMCCIVPIRQCAQHQNRRGQGTVRPPLVWHFLMVPLICISKLDAILPKGTVSVPTRGPLDDPINALEAKGKDDEDKDDEEEEDEEDEEEKEEEEAEEEGRSNENEYHNDDDDDEEDARVLHGGMTAEEYQKMMDDPESQ